MLTVKEDDIEAASWEGIPPPGVFEIYDMPDDKLVGFHPPCYRADLHHKNGDCVNWAYTIDLDHEVFSVGNSFHWKLNQVPRDNMWKHMTRHTSLDTMLDVVPKLRAECPEPWILRSYRFRVVLAKDIHHFDKHRRHGPLLLSALWKQFQKSHSLAIGNHLRSWKPDDFAFREYA